MSASNYLARKFVDLALGGQALSAPATVYFAAFSAPPDDSGSGTELAGNGYARVPITNNLTNWPAASGALAAAKSNGTAIAFPTATANWASPVVAWGIFDASSSGNLLYWGHMIGTPYVFGGDPATDVLTAPGHTLSNGDPVRLEPVLGKTLPTPLAAATTYYVRDVNGATLKLAASGGGAAIDLTAAGPGTIGKLMSKSVASGDTLTFPVGSVVIIQD
jgi:hypothetical protein